MSKLSAFKAYDIRGVYGKEITPELFFKTGKLLPSVLNARQILVGWDARLSSEPLKESLVRGLTSVGCDVVLAGLSTTPMIYWGTGALHFDASVMITASHNPANHNGLKVSGKYVAPIGYDNGLKTIEQAILRNNLMADNKKRGEVSSISLREKYLDFLAGVRGDYGGLKIAVDTSNGMAGLFAKKLFGKDTIYLNDDIDGTFPGHDPNPLNPANQTQLKETVINENCDAGLIFDGDADRVMFIDEKGHFISPDLIIGLLGDYFFGDRKEKGCVVQDIRTSKAVAEYLTKYGVEVETWKVGRAFGATKLKELDGIYGGELAGHYYFRDFYYSDSGILAALIILKILAGVKQQGKKLSEVISSISTYANTGEVNFRVEKKKQVMDAIKDHFFSIEPPVRFLDFDGYRLEFNDWWFNIRPSNTEPYLRFLAEAKNKNLLDEKTGIIYDIVNSFS